MQDRIEVRTASDGYRLACRHVTPADTPRGWILVLHGIQSHSGWYEFTQQHLARAGYDVRFPDRRGSGLNEVDRGHAPHWSRLINDVVHFLQDARGERDRRNPGAPIILGGLSWGGRLALAVAQLRPEFIDQLVLLYPGLVNRIDPGIADRCRLKLAEQLGITHRRIAVPLDDPALFTLDKRWQDFIRQDRLALHAVTTGFLIANQHLTAICRNSGSQTPVPRTLLMLAGQDRIVDNPRTRRLAAARYGAALSICEFPDAQHTLEFEPCRDQYIRTLVEWLDVQQEVTCRT